MLGPGSPEGPRSSQPPSYSWIRPPRGQRGRTRKRLGVNRSDLLTHKLSLSREPPKTHSLLSPARWRMGPIVFQRKQTTLKPDSKLLCCVSLGPANLVTGDKEGCAGTSLSRAAQPSSLRHSSQAELWRMAKDTWGGDLPKHWSLNLGGRKSLCCFLCSSFISVPITPYLFLSPLGWFLPGFPITSLILCISLAGGAGTRCGDGEVRYRH